MRKFILFILIWGGVFYLGYQFLRIYQADVAYTKSQRYLSLNDLSVAKLLVNQAVEKNPYEPNYYRGRAKVAIVEMADLSQIGQKELKKYALSDLEKAYNLNSNNLVTIRNEMSLYYFLALSDIRIPGSAENIDPEYFEATKSFFERNKERFKHDAGVVTLIAKYEKRLGMTKEFGDSVKIIAELRPDLLEWHEVFTPTTQ